MTGYPPGIPFDLRKALRGTALNWEDWTNQEVADRALCLAPSMIMSAALLELSWHNPYMKSLDTGGEVADLRYAHSLPEEWRRP